ncbi:MAG TPA: amidase [Terracidiphilus sp.]|jgi:Asp-tRNA(Asn)/Glu-tRNA(Gln) amidotransferase A subunit family amidase|nr:amidase [Terracidiphilus sp.]
MSPSPKTVRALRKALAEGALRPTELAAEALTNANQNAGRNTYLWRDETWTLVEAERAEKMPRGEGAAFGDGRPALWGLPISVKDCFDLAGAPTSCGVQFYRDLNGTALHDSWLVERLRAAGAVITGKTHLHPLAYGITGENLEFGDCVQPGNPTALTGGSSSGAAASVLEGSAVAAIGTDTGGSVRAPAALCGLAGYRATLGRGNWQGAGHLAESFDTMGWLFRDLEDAPLLGSLFTQERLERRTAPKRFAVIDAAFLHDCEPEIVDSLERTARELEGLGLQRGVFDASWWAGAFDIFAPIQASEAARIHAGHFRDIEEGTRKRLEWGESLTTGELRTLRNRHADFRQRVQGLLASHELLLLPAAPTARLAAGADHSQTRARILRYTSPFSLAGVPVVTIPCSSGGMQLAAAPENDEALLQLAAELGARRKAAASQLA